MIPIRFHLKYLYWALALIFLSLLGAFAAMAFSPTIQRWVLVKTIGAFTEQCKLEYARINFHSITLKNLYVLSDKGAIGLKSLTLNAPLLQLLSKENLNINSLLINELEVDATKNNVLNNSIGIEPPKPSKSTVYEPLPLKNLTIKSLKIDGVCYLPDEKVLSFNTEAQNITPTTEGQIELKASLKEKDRQTANVAFKANITQEMIDAKRVWNIQLTGNGSGKTGIQNLKGPFSSLGFDIRLNSQIHPEWIKSPLFNLKISTGNNRKLLDINLLQNIKFPVNGDLTTLGTLKGKLLSIELQPTPLKLFTPFIPAIYEIEGQMDALKVIIEGQQETLIAKTQKPLAINGLQVKYKDQPWIENINLTHHLSLALTPKIKKQGPITLEKLVLKEGYLQLNQGENQPLGNITLLSPLNLPLNGQLSALLEGQGALLNFEINDLPLSLTRPFFDRMTLAGHLTDFKGTLELNDKKLRWTSITPLNFKDLTVHQDGNTLVEALNGWIRPEFEGTFESFKAGMESFSLRNEARNPWGTGSLKTEAHLTPKGQINYVDINAHMTTDLKECFNQPFLKPYNLFETGTSLLSLGIAGNPEGALNFDVSQSLKNIQLKATTQQPDALTALQITGKGTYAHPNLTTTLKTSYDSAFGPSDLLCNLKADDHQWAIEMISERLQLDPLWALTQNKNQYTVVNTAEVASKDASSPNQSVALDKKAFWSCGPNIDFKSSFKKIAQNKKIVAENLIARFRMDDQAMKLEALTGTIFNAPFNSNGQITFNSKVKKPYHCEAVGTLKSLNIAELIAFQNPNKNSPIEGRFDSEFNLNGTGYNAPSLFEKLQGHFQLEGKNGVLHVLDAAGAPAQVGAMAIGIAGALLGQKTPPSVQVANDLIKLLKTIEYDECLFKAERGDNLNIQLSECLVRGPTLRLTGTGQITYEVNKPVVDQPLRLTAQMDAAGQSAQLMQNLRLTDIRKKDAAGYSAGPQFSIKGTLAQPDFSELYGLITKAGSSLVLPPSEASKDNNKSLSPDKLLRGIFGG